MVTRIIICLVGSVIFQSCDCTDVDEFGQRVIVEVPIQSSPAQANFTVGDTIWWEADFSNQVRVEGVDRKLNLAGFDFFAEFGIQQIPENVLVPTDIDVVSDVSVLTLFSTSELLVYDIGILESDERFRFKFGIIPRKSGVYYAGVATNISFDEVDHPALYACKETRREDFRIHYPNTSTDRSAYEEIFLPNVTSDIVESSTFEKYSDVGSISFIVAE